MKKLYLLLPILFLIYWGCEDDKEEEPIIFVNTFGGSGGDYGNSVQQTTDGGFIITGGTFRNGEYDILLIKTEERFPFVPPSVIDSVTVE